MSDEELERMRGYAEAAKEHPTWSVAYAQDVPKLLAEVAQLRVANARMGHGQQIFQEDLGDLLTALEMGNYARPQSPHDVMRETIEEARRLRRSERLGRLSHRLRFCEMVLDRLNAEIDGVPWRQAARLSEALEGEPVTAAEPVEKRLGECEHAVATLKSLLADVAASGVEHDDARMDYVTVQIDRSVWNQLLFVRSQSYEAPSPEEAVRRGRGDTVAQTGDTDVLF